MMTPPSHITEKRIADRRASQHTPEDCPNLLTNKSAINEINKRLDDGTGRMGRIESSVAEVNATLAANAISTLEHRRKSEAGLREVHTRLAESEQQTAEHRLRLEAKVDATSSATAELLEIIQMGKGFFRGVAWTGKWLRRILLWVLPVATAVMAFWYTLTGHVPPK